jgi:hypothetical protein
MTSKTEITLTFETDSPSQIDRVLFEAIKNAVGNSAHEGDIEILTQILIASIKEQEQSWEEILQTSRDEHETHTIQQAVKAALNGEISDADASDLGTLRTAKIQNAINS